MTLERQDKLQIITTITTQHNTGKRSTQNRPENLDVMKKAYFFFVWKIAFKAFILSRPFPLSRLFFFFLALTVPFMM